MITIIMESRVYASRHAQQAHVLLRVLLKELPLVGVGSMASLALALGRPLRVDVPQDGRTAIQLWPSTFHQKLFMFSASKSETQKTRGRAGWEDKTHLATFVVVIQ